MELRQFSLTLLGGLALRSTSGEPVNISARKSRALLVYLALAPNGSATRDRVASLLWSDTDLQFAKTNLRQCLSALRKQIDNKTHQLIRNNEDLLQLDLAKVSIDVHELSSLDELDASTAAGKLSNFNHGTLLPDFPLIDAEFDQWLDEQRGSIQNRYCRTIETFLDGSDLPTGSSSDHLKILADELLLVEPANEKAHAWLLRFYAETGDRSAALRQFQCCREVLKEQLDVEPGPEISTLYESIRQAPVAKVGRSNPLNAGGTQSLKLPEPVRTYDDEEPVQPDRTSLVRGFTEQRWRPVAFLLMPVAIVLIGLALLDSSTETGMGGLFQTSNTKVLEEPQVVTQSINSTPANPTRQYSIAVIPFRNLSGDPEQLYLSDGLSEDLLTEISRVSGLSVMASQSSFLFRDADENLENFKATLPVDYMLHGSVRRVGDELRINAHLMRVMDATLVWSDKFDRKMGDVLQVQDEITRHIVSSLQVELTESEWQRLSVNREVSAEAYDLLLRGLHPFSQFTEEGVNTARDYFKRSIAADVNYARPHANMALSFGRELVFQFAEPNPVSIRTGLEYADTAERLDPSLPQTQFARAVLLLANRDHQAAVGAARRSITLDANYADGFAVLAQTLAYKGELDTALEAIARAKELNPVVPFMYHWVEGHILYQLGRYEDARVALELVYQSNPSFYTGLLTLSATYGQLKQTEEADWINGELLLHRPGISAAKESDGAPYFQQRHRDHLLDGLIRAGLPG